MTTVKELFHHWTLIYGESNVDHLDRSREAIATAILAAPAKACSCFLKVTLTKKRPG